jgi:pyruvate dehydrogenase E2 component (dihydrolipoamide acetyltransferase)
VKTNDIIVEIETAKSLVELPCPFAGVVAELLVPEGQTVDVGTPIISVDVGVPGGGGSAGSDSGSAATTGSADGSGDLPGAAPGATDVQPAPVEGSVEPGLIGGPAPGGRTSVLVGYGPRTTSAVRRPRKANVDSLAEVPVKPQRHGGLEIGRIVEQQLVEQAEQPPAEPHRRPHTPTGGAAPAAHAGGPVLAKPPVRKLARDLGVDLHEVTPTGPNGTVSRDDVHSFAAGGESEAEVAPARPLRAVAPGERETRTPIKGVRKMTAQTMVASAFTAPHVTEFVTIDITRTMELVERLRSDREFRDVKVSPLLLVAKALLIAVRRNPEINASWDEAAQEIVVKHYVNLGIAAATPRGLVVPNIKDAHDLSLRELADELAALTATARAGRTQPAEMAGGTISITNVGVFGVDTGTPILNAGEAAILCIGQIAKRPWVVDDQVVPRQVTTLGVSFDHRLVDGDLGSRFLSDIAQLLEFPDKAFLWA